MSDDAHEAPKSAVPLVEAIGVLRDELTQAWLGGREKVLRFRPSPVVLTSQAAGKGRAGVRWWLVEFGSEPSRQSVTTQIAKLTPNPIILDERTGVPVELLIDAADPLGP